MNQFLACLFLFILLVCQFFFRFFGHFVDKIEEIRIGGLSINPQSFSLVQHLFKWHLLHVETYRGDICQVLINWKYSNSGKSGAFWRIFFRQHFLTIGWESQTTLYLLHLRLYVILDNRILCVISWSRTKNYEYTVRHQGLRVHWCTSTGLAPAAPAPGSAAATTGSQSGITTLDITTLLILRLLIFTKHM